MIIPSKLCRAVETWGKGAIAAKDLGKYANPISIKGADFALHITTRPSGFSDLPTALLCNDG